MTDTLALDGQPAGPSSPVWSHNEWDPLEEVIVGVVDGAVIPPWHVSLEATAPEHQRELFQRHAGERFPDEVTEAAAAEMAGFVEILEREGVTVRRPDPVDQSRSFGAPGWQSTGGLAHTFARDNMLVAGDLMVEATMGWRSYYYAIHPYRRIIKDYFRRGARWVAAPKPELADDSFNPRYADVHAAGFPPESSVVTEWEPLFDAGDFMRCGRDIFVQRSHVTNAAGIEWVRRLLSEEHRMHEVCFDDPHPMHINATFLPLAPGKVLVNPDRVRDVPPMFADWDLLPAPEPCLPADQPLYMCSRWISTNVLMLDPERVFVDAGEHSLIGMLEKWGFTPIPVPFRNVNSLGGGFHCASLDVRRRGGLEDYFS